MHADVHATIEKVWPRTEAVHGCASVCSVITGGKGVFFACAGTGSLARLYMLTSSRFRRSSAVNRDRAFHDAGFACSHFTERVASQ